MYLCDQMDLVIFHCLKYVTNFQLFLLKIIQLADLVTACQYINFVLINSLDHVLIRSCTNILMPLASLETHGACVQFIQSLHRY